ncbi:hypothetical protein AGMMS49975_20620 [Clostridia bacterium]|nr:hypothetical protein AGMMS49975_20620 [Clostridia bacterium]
MYQIIDNPTRMTKAEIDKEYDGKWVYLVNCEYANGPTALLTSGIPVVVADLDFEGVDTNRNLYARWRCKEYAPRHSYSRVHHDGFVSSLFI